MRICGQILRDLEQHRCLQAGGHRLAQVDAARDHHAVDGRADLRARQVDARLFQRRLARLQRGLGILDLRLRDDQIALGKLQLLACILGDVSPRSASARRAASAGRSRAWLWSSVVCALRSEASCEPMLARATARSACAEATRCW